MNADFTSSTNSKSTKSVQAWTLSEPCFRHASKLDNEYPLGRTPRRYAIRKWPASCCKNTINWKFMSDQIEGASQSLSRTDGLTWMTLFLYLLLTIWPRVSRAKFFTPPLKTIWFEYPQLNSRKVVRVTYEINVCIYIYILCVCVMYQINWS